MRHKGNPFGHELMQDSTLQGLSMGEWKLGVQGRLVLRIHRLPAAWVRSHGARAERLKFKQLSVRILWKV